MARKAHLALIAALATALVLGGCGRKGPLEAPGTDQKTVQTKKPKGPQPVVVPPGPPREQAGPFPTRVPDDPGKIGNL